MRGALLETRTWTDPAMVGSGVLIKIFNTRLNTNTTLSDGGYFTAFKNKFGFKSAV